MFGFDAGNTGHRPEVTGPGSKPHYQWSLDYDQGSAFMATNAVFAAGTLVVNGPDYRIRGVDPATGTERWQWAYPAEFGNEGTPAVAAGGVFHGVEALYRLDLDTGQRQWTAEVPLFPRASPTVADGVVYVPTDGVAAVDAASGEIRWRESLGRAEGAPAVQGSSVVANVRTETGSTVTCLDAETGEERWSFARDEWFRAPPAVRGSTVYVGASDGRLSALALDTGEERWAVETGQRIWMSPAVDESRVYVGTDDGRLVTVDRDAGKRQWSRELEGAVRSTVRVGESLYAGTLGSTLSALDPDDGSTTWEYTTPHPVFNDPVVTADRVYLATEDGMFALQP
jgi:outer membrane protein assembly factor BamB